MVELVSFKRAGGGGWYQSNLRDFFIICFVLLTFPCTEKLSNLPYIYDMLPKRIHLYIKPVFCVMAALFTYVG